MCGIAGKLALSIASETTEVDIQKMLLELKHRGPDEMGVYTNGQVGLGATRLGIVDPGGHQPMSNPDKTLWLLFSGSI